MTMKRLALTVLCLCLAFAAGLAVPRPMPRPAPLAAPTAIPVAAPTADACRSELVNARMQLAICLAFRAPPEPSVAPLPSVAPAAPPELDAYTARLVRTNTTNTETVTVRTGERGFRVYPPGAWPPPDGPDPGARVIARRLDGGTEVYDADGGSRIETDGPPISALLEAFRARDAARDAGRIDSGPPPEATP
jgi:hypothetical protein